MATKITLLNFITAVAEHSASEAETIATVVYMVNSGHVRLGGTFKGARFDLDVAADPGHERRRSICRALQERAVA